VAAFAADPERRRAYGVSGRAAVDGHTWAAIGDELIDHYGAVLAGRAGAPRRLAVAA
jgi:phosphatidylinositol alpha 1,6-mannosyltransferase